MAIQQSEALEEAGYWAGYWHACMPVHRLLVTMTRRKNIDRKHANCRSRQNKQHEIILATTVLVQYYSILVILSLQCVLKSKRETQTER